MEKDSTGSMKSIERENTDPFHSIPFPPKNGKSRHISDAFFSTKWKPSFYNVYFLTIYHSIIFLYLKSEF